MFFAALGIISSVILLIGDYPYIRETIKGNTKPERVTWGTVFLLNSIGFANQLASGANNSLWLFGAAALATGIIFALSIFKGVGGHTNLDIFTGIVALLGLALWIIFDSPTFSIIATLVVVIVALLPTFAKAKKHPETETRITWLLGSVSALLATISVGALDWKLLILPINATILQAYMVYILYFETKKRTGSSPMR
jgi:hypothetical protein